MTAVRTSRRIAVASADRDRLAAARPLPDGFATLVGKANLHGFRELTTGLGGAQCVDCLGWRDDPRHTYPRGSNHG